MKQTATIDGKSGLIITRELYEFANEACGLKFEAKELETQISGLIDLAKDVLPDFEKTLKIKTETGFVVFKREKTPKPFIKKGYLKNVLSALLGRTTDIELYISVTPKKPLNEINDRAILKCLGPEPDDVTDAVKCSFELA